MNEEISFEERLENAKKILAKLQEPEISLKESIELYKKGKEELKSAIKMLEEAELELEEYNENLNQIGEED